MMIMRSWGPVQTSLLNDAETSLVCWSGKCFANHSRVREPDAQGCFYAMIYFEQILSFCIEIQTSTLQITAGSEREMLKDVSCQIRNDPAIIFAIWHLPDKNKPYHEQLECNGSVFIFNLVPCLSLLLDYVQYLLVL